MPTIPNPEYPMWEVLRMMLLVTGGIVAFLILMTLVLAILTYITRLLFVPRTRWQIQRNGVEEFEKLGFDTIERRY